MRIGLGIVAAFAAISLGGCSLFVGSGCTDDKATTWDLHEPTDPSTTLKIEDCRQDVDACDVLCTMELDANASNVNTMTGCQVLFDGETIHVEVKYQVDSNDPGCEVLGDDEPVPVVSG